MWLFCACSQELLADSIKVFSSWIFLHRSFLTILIIVTEQLYWRKILSGCFHFIWLWLLITIMKRCGSRCTLQLNHISFNNYNITKQISNLDVFKFDVSGILRSHLKKSLYFGIWSFVGLGLKKFLYFLKRNFS